MNYFLGIDIGTTEIKFKLFSDSKPKLAFSYLVKTYYEERSVYQNPKEILYLVKKGIKKTYEEVGRIDEISFSTAMHTIIPKSRKTNNLKMYIWSDNQASEVVSEFRTTELAEQFYKRTGTPVHAMTPFSKILFFKQKKEVYFETIYQWQDLKAFIFSELTGNNVTDYSNATATGLFNSLQFVWDQKIIDFLGINVVNLPKCKHPEKRFDLLQEVIEDLEINPDVDIILGASDGCLATLAAYENTGEIHTLTLGTSGAVRKVSKTRELNYKSNQFCYYITNDLWVIGGATNNGGKVLEWLQHSFYGNQVNVYTVLKDALIQIDYKKNLPIFLPYIQGERAPIWANEVAGELAGLTIAHNQKDIIISVAESILFNLKKVSEMVSFQKKETVLILSGGFFKTPELIQLTANIFNMKVSCNNNVDPVDGLLLLSRKTKKVEHHFSTVSPMKDLESQFYYNSRYELFINQLRKSYF